MSEQDVTIARLWWALDELLHVMSFRMPPEHSLGDYKVRMAQKAHDSIPMPAPIHQASYLARLADDAARSAASKVDE